jgi:hypothetical protein
MAQEGTPFTDGAKGFKLQCPLLRYTAMMWLAVKCYDRMFPVGFFILKVKIRAAMPHIRGKFCYTSSFVEGLRCMTQITLARWSWLGSVSHSRSTSLHCSNNVDQ